MHAHVSMEKEMFVPTDGAGQTRTWKINEPWPLPHNLHKFNIRWIIDLTIKKLNIKFNEDRISSITWGRQIFLSQDTEKYKCNKLKIVI